MSWKDTKYPVPPKFGEKPHFLDEPQTEDSWFQDTKIVAKVIGLLVLIAGGVGLFGFTLLKFAGKF